MGTFFNFLGNLFTQFFKIMPIIGDLVNYFLILALTVATFYWIWYMIKNPKGDGNYLSKP